jgi:hypothetical protein
VDRISIQPIYAHRMRSVFLNAQEFLQEYCKGS